MLIAAPPVLDSASYDAQVVRPIAQAVTRADEDLWLDVFVVGAGRLHVREPDPRDSLPFDSCAPSSVGHMAAAYVLAGRVTGLLHQARRTAGRDSETSCLLNTLHRARHALVPRDGEVLRLVIASDLIERCPEAGPVDMAEGIPTALSYVPALPALAGVQRVHLWEVDHPTIRSIGADVRLDSLWTRHLRRQGAPEVRRSNSF